ncbi:MAG: adenine-specific methyltransferase EcoRI family protein [Lachnospiraceae bacterium]|nr:adenine-specific methyltransferase EcoRI family protein [Lachnospiraceae bacterium]
MANNNTILGAAKTAKKDEFYTQLTDIEKEVRHYKKHFKDKIVLCNCDDPFESNFFKYFVLNFNKLGLRKLIATCYSTSPIRGKQFDYTVDVDGQMSFFIENVQLSSLLVGKPTDSSKKPYKAVVTTVYDKTGDGGISMHDIAKLFESGENTLEELSGDGDFRSEECINILREADIVVTNPPFSLFRDYINTLVKYGKKFLVIGNQNAIKYSDIFPLFMENKIWLGYGFQGNVGFFESPYEDTAVSSQHKEGLIRVSGVMWFTNMDIKKRHEELILTATYSEGKYIKFDNYDAINIDKVIEIPCDYEGIMGVPITFMDKFNPEQFELYGRTGNIEWAESNECDFFTPPSVEQQIIYKKQNKTWRVQNGYYVEDGVAITVYDRLFIRNKRPEKPLEVNI